MITWVSGDMGSRGVLLISASRITFWTRITRLQVRKTRMSGFQAHETRINELRTCGLNRHRIHARGAGEQERTRIWKAEIHCTQPGRAGCRRARLGWPAGRACAQLRRRFRL